MLFPNVSSLNLITELGNPSKWNKSVIEGSGASTSDVNAICGNGYIQFKDVSSKDAIRYFMFISNVKIDLTSFKSLTIKSDRVSAYTTTQFGIVSSLNATSVSKVLAAAGNGSFYDRTVDISGYTGEYYFAFYFPSLTSACNVKFTELTLIS